MALRVQVTFDAADPHKLAAWWADLLGYSVEDSHDFVSELLASGVITKTDVVEFDGRLAFADAVAAHDPEGTGPRLYFQRVPEPKVAKNRVHLDVPVNAEDLDAEVERLTSTGARHVEFGSHPGHRWAVMQDPEGNEFCLA
jgi:predicted enzyme related to lactoylglutathione lyase